MPKNSLPTLGSLDHFLIIPRSLVSSPASLLHYFTFNNSIQCFVHHFATVTESHHILVPLCKNCTKTINFWGGSVSTPMSTIGAGEILVKLSATVIISVISNSSPMADDRSGAMQWWCYCYVCIKLLVQTVSNLVKFKAICQVCFRYCSFCHCFRSSCVQPGALWILTKMVIQSTNSSN